MARKTSSTAKKTTSAKAARPVKAAPPKTVPTTTPAAAVDAPEVSVVNTMKKQDLINKVAELSGVKKPDVKKVLDAALSELGDALQRGDDLRLPPLGKFSVNRQREAPNAHIVMTKLRRPKAMLEGQGETSGAGAEES